jgi:hypothetical protein
VAVDPQLRRQIVRAVLMVAGIAVVIGLVVALTATAALRMAGVSGDDGPPPTVAEPDPDELPSPDTVEPTPSEGPSASPGPSQRPSDSPSKGPGESPSKSPGPTKSDKPQQITLTASASSASSMQQVGLSGSYPGGNGVTLQVQRREGGSWAPFPTSATVDGGRFSTYVALGQPGPNRLRVVDPRSGQASNVVVIDVG